MAKGSKKNKERAAAQANKARRVEKRKAAAPKPAAPKAAAPKAASRPSGNNPGLTTAQIRQKRVDKGLKPAAPKPGSRPSGNNPGLTTAQIRQKRIDKGLKPAANNTPEEVVQTTPVDQPVAEIQNTTIPQYEMPNNDYIDSQLDSFRDDLARGMEMQEDPRNRRYVLGIRTKRGKRNRQGTRGTFGRQSNRVKGLQSTSINL